MSQSARRLAGITRNVLPKRFLEPKKHLVFGSEEEYQSHLKQKAKWKRKTDVLLKTAQGRQYLSQHFPKIYQRYLQQKRNPQQAVEQEEPEVTVDQKLKQLSPNIHTQIMRKKIPQLPQIPPFPIGKQKIYLPDFVIALKRNERLEPYHAVFEVPLNFSKLDMRDYLFHVYNVKVLSIRSSVLPGILRRKYKLKAGQGFRVQKGPMMRTRARKKMIVQLVKPFRFPRPLDKQDLKEIGADRYEKVKENVRLQKKRFAIAESAKPHPMYKHSGKLRYGSREETETDR